MSRVVVDIVFQIAESKGQFFPIIIMITPKAAPSQEGYEKDQLVWYPKAAAPSQGSYRRLKERRKAEKRGSK